MTAGQDRVARLWSLPAAAPGMSSSGAGSVSPLVSVRSGAADAGMQGVIGSVALELELTGHGLSNPNTGKDTCGRLVAVLLCC